MFKSKNFCHIASNNRNTVKVGVFVYRTTDDLDTVTASGYFNERIIDINLHDLIIHEQIDATDNTKVVRNVLCVSERTLDNVNTIVVKSKWEGDIEQEIEDLRTYVDNTFVKKDGSSIMTGPLKFIAGSYSGAIAGGLGDGIEIYKINSSGTIQSEVASLTLTNGFLPGTNNAMNIGSSSRKWKDAYISRVITSVLNNGANISIPTTSGTMALISDIAIKSTEANIVNPTAGQWLQYNGTKWENISLTPANTDLSNLSSTGANIGNWSSNVSNCLVEIPQDLNIVLSSGSLIIKAGTKAYMPNGTVVSVANDITVTASSTLNRLLFLNSAGTGVDYINVNSFYSGTTAPTVTGTARWFDTANLVIKQTTDSGATWTTLNETLPIAIFHTTSGSIDSVEVFNGFGYFGSSIFALPGVKILIPQGRNADGTLKNKAHTVPSIRYFTSTSGTYNNYAFVVAENGLTVYTVAYNPETNYVYRTDTGATYSDRIIAGTVDITSGRITRLETKQPFHAVDYNDLKDTEAKIFYPDLFDAKWSDHLVNNTSWVRADSFSWQSGTTYSKAYQHLVADIAGKTLQSETIGGVTVQFYLANDGHKICPATEESNVSSIYTATGVAWYYVLDTGNTRFKLPRTQFGFTGLRDAVGKYVEAGLPNITGSIGYAENSIGGIGGAFYKGGNSGGNCIRANSDHQQQTLFDASVSNSVYGNSTTVQPQATQMYLYFYVGQFTQTALENTAGINASSFNAKADLDLLNTNANVDFVIESQEPTVDNNYTWYRKYRSGWVEQGGIVSSTPANITFPVEMADTNYYANACPTSNGSSNYSSAVQSRTTTGAQILFYDETRPACWEVKGMAA